MTQDERQHIASLVDGLISPADRNEPSYSAFRRAFIASDSPKALNDFFEYFGDMLRKERTWFAIVNKELDAEKRHVRQLTAIILGGPS